MSQWLTRWSQEEFLGEDSTKVHFQGLRAANFFFCLHRRVHISQSTKDSLHGEFELEPGNGGERCDYLQEKDIDTYLVLPPKHLPNELNGNVSALAENSDALLSLCHDD